MDLQPRVSCLPGSANVLRSSPAQSNRGVHSFFGSSSVAANDGLFPSGSAFSWGSAVGLGGMFWLAGEPFSNRNSAGTVVGTSVGRFRRGPYRTLSWYW